MACGGVIHRLAGGHDGDVVLADILVLIWESGEKRVPAKSPLKVGQSSAGFRGLPDCAISEVRFATMAGSRKRKRKFMVVSLGEYLAIL